MAWRDGVDENNFEIVKRKRKRKRMKGMRKERKRK
jgi:hypothetical protein